MLIREQVAGSNRKLSSNCRRTSCWRWETTLFCAFVDLILLQNCVVICFRVCFIILWWSSGWTQDKHCWLSTFVLFWLISSLFYFMENVVFAIYYNYKSFVFCCFDLFTTRLSARPESLISHKTIHSVIEGVNNVSCHEQY